MEYVSSGYPDNLLLHWDHTGFLWYACWFALISYYHSRGYFYCDTTKNLRNISFWGFPRGADRIWTGESGCCRPTPYHLATAPYFVVSPKTNDSNGNRTRVTAVKGRCLNRLTMEPCLYHCFSDDRVIYYHSSIRIASVFWKFFYSFFLLLFLHFYSMFLNPKYSVFKSLFHSFQRLWS